MIVTDTCAPAFPPVPMSIGMNAVNAAQDTSASSKDWRMREVNVEESIRMRSHGIRAFHRANTGLRR